MTRRRTITELSTSDISRMRAIVSAALGQARAAHRGAFQVAAIVSTSMAAAKAPNQPSTVRKVQEGVWRWLVDRWVFDSKAPSPTKIVEFSDGSVQMHFGHQVFTHQLNPAVE